MLTRIANNTCIPMCVCAQVLKQQKSSFTSGFFILFSGSTPFFLSCNGLSITIPVASDSSFPSSLPQMFLEFSSVLSAEVLQKLWN